MVPRAVGARRADLQRRARGAAPRPARRRRAPDGVRDHRRAAREPAQRRRDARPRAEAGRARRRGRSSCPSSTCSRLPARRARGRARPPPARAVARAVRPRADLMLRATLFRLGEDDAVLLVRMHHIAADGFSDRVLFGELRERLRRVPRRARRRSFPSSRSSTRTTPSGSVERLQGKLLERARGATGPTASTARRRCCRCRPTGRAGRCSATRAAATTCALPQELADGVARRRPRRGRDRLHGAPRRVLGTALPRHRRGRRRRRQPDREPHEHRARRRLIGLFSNTIALRSRLGGNPSFRESARPGARDHARRLRAPGAAVRDASSRRSASGATRPTTRSSR